MNKPTTEEQIEFLIKKLTETVQRLDVVESEYKFIKIYTSDMIKRVSALEHPSMDAPLKAFQKLRAVLQEVDNANFRETLPAQ